MTTTDVLVIGAGPTGLLLAGDLAAAGVGVTVIERRTTESNLTRAFAVHARTLEELDARGVADELVAAGRPLASLRLFGSVALDLGELPTRFPFLLVAPQYATEQVLERRALAAGAVITRGLKVTGVRQDDTGAEVDTVDDAGAVATHQASYVVGTDGHRSAVREALGLSFPGESAVLSVVLADVRMTEPPEHLLTADSGPAGFVFTAPFGDGWYRIIAWDRDRQLPDSAPVDLEELRALMVTLLGTDHGMHSPRWTSRFHSDERQVERYRVGRVFLAGDAAHVHSPAGGQGMNTGIQDAANLGWKLAAAVQGWAPEGLLDTYNAERHPVGRTVLKTSGTLLRMALLGSNAARGLRNVLVKTAMSLPAVARRATGMLSGVGIAYDAPKGAHRPAGERAADVPLVGGRLYELLRAGRHVLIPGEGAKATVDGRFETGVAAEPGDTTLLVRPDGYIAWAGRDASSAQIDAALAAAGLTA
ncbi:FAD-dependent monooxygenase [Phytomonospora endophytica]|uniref:2-polyprenyl-6-methoxyphenol hydroxylase-like FAD-dependent oxidoreductase n=1 Tax=Phytomonospora endophytica TaxID=714109 RepID=A0A841FMA8_9ACTN|nr:FAD-dependent monooxygenase [Phytomonospora endophytica]MBB6036994.1 2-polyprenyl-6-methoxyphenol hydroxylase-like FAD-dependent oxidoreductase [Phytomonospora endophytica]GIG69462.1 FAD-dependent oxidoreductase [Phytomonospora endophytica]